ncbi:MAG: hypothetical protein HY720_02575 [Planctomycetes bacterium]|nr:hypothetical protein [Planctomycetota bacterium]
MKTRLGSLATLALTLSLALPVSAQETPFPEPDNAALDYWRAFSQMSEPADDLAEAVSDVVRGEAAYDDARLGEYLAANQAALAEFEKGARLDRCDFGLRYEEGPAILLPHLAKARSLARLAILDGKRAESHGKWGQAFDRYLATVRLARHMDQDRILISTLVAISLSGLAFDAVAGALDRAPEDADLLRRLGTELALLDGHVVNAAAAVRMEGRAFSAYFRSVPPEQIARDAGLLGPGGTDDEETIQKLARDLGVDPETLKSEKFWSEGLDDYEKWVAAVADLLEKPWHESRERLQELEDEAAAKTSHPFLKLLAPALVKVADRAAEIAVKVRMVRVLAALALARAEGGTLPESLDGIEFATDPAAGKPFVWRREEGAAVLESVFQDGAGKGIAYRLGEKRK